jgi:hypothetical protein
MSKKHLDVLFKLISSTDFGDMVQTFVVKEDSGIKILAPLALAAKFHKTPGS